MTSAPPTFDAIIERIVREVLRRLQSQSHRVAMPTVAPSAEATVSVQEKLITAATLERLPVGTRVVTIPQRAVVTPLARDEARDRGIRLEKVSVK